MFSCQNNHELCARALIEAGADLDKVTDDGQAMSALFVACSQGHESCARLLIEKGADVNKESKYGTALKMARKKGHAAICALLEA